MKVQNDVTDALLDRWNVDGNFVASYRNYHITSQELSLLCGERYLSDETINMLIQRYCDVANEKQNRSRYLLLPSFLSTGEFPKDIVRNVCDSVDISMVDTMYPCTGVSWFYSLMKGLHILTMDITALFQNNFKRIQEPS